MYDTQERIKRRIGNSILEVSRICLGCMGFGNLQNGQHSWTLDEEHFHEIIKYALEQGINFFDTAVGYQNGTSGQYVGRVLRDFAKHEEVIVTQFLPCTNEDIAEGISGQQHIERMIPRALKIWVDYLDLYISILYEIIRHLSMNLWMA